MTNDVKWPRVASLVVVCLCLTPAIASSQDNADLRDFDLTRESASAGPCQEPQCQRRLREIGAAAEAAAHARAAFVTALRQLVEGLPGTYGDEGPRIRASVSDMATALARWDEAIGKYRDALSAARGADAYAALGSTYLDRGRISDAVEQFRRAVDLAPAWAESSLLLALASEAVGAHDEAARAFTRAGRASPDNPAIGYARVQHAIASGDERLVSRALLDFRDRHERPRARDPTASAAPFVRLGLLRETAGVAPVFVPAGYADGLRLLNARQYDEAIGAFRQSIDRDPLASREGDVDERVAAGKQLRDGSVSAAIAQLERAVARLPDRAELRRLLAVAYAADERYEQSIEQLIAAIQRDATDERSRLALAEVYLAAGQPDAAERTLRETTAAMPGSGWAQYRLGRLYESRSRVPEAIASFARSAQHPILVGRDALYETIAALRVGEGEFTDAMTAYRLELDANPNNAVAHRRLGDLYSQEGRLDESLAEYAAALLIDPRDADTHASRAHTLLRMSRFAEAEAAARTAVSLSPRHEPARYALGAALMRTGRTDEGLLALQEFERLQAATRARNDADWQLKLLKEQALDHAARQDYRGAADLLRRALAYAPSDGSVHLAAGALLVRAGDFEQAVLLLEEALGRETLDAHRYLAEAYAALGRDEESRAHRIAYDAVKAARMRQGAAEP
jgi:tetratricopeptide (TPR) repeat protein